MCWRKSAGNWLKIVQPSSVWFFPKTNIANEIVQTEGSVPNNIKYRRLKWFLLTVLFAVCLQNSGICKQKRTEWGNLILMNHCKQSLMSFSSYFSIKDKIWKKNWSQLRKNRSQILHISHLPISTLCRHIFGRWWLWVYVRLSASFCKHWTLGHPDATWETRVQRTGDSIKQKTLTIFLIVSVFVGRSSFSKWSWAGSNRRPYK